MSNELVPQKQRTMMIKNLCPGLMELGKIKIGNKGQIRQSQGGGTWQAPQKLDHFLITTMERGKDNNFVVDERLHKLFDPTGDRPIRSIPVRLIYDDISLNFATRYICYYGKTVFCSGDGEDAQRLQQDRKTYATRTCPCERQDPTFAGDDGKGKGKCKINGILSVIIDGAQAVGGVWKFRTTSYNTVVGILSSLALIQRVTGGRLAGIPMNMTVSPKTVQDPINQTQQIVYIVGLQYAGTIDTLRDTGYQIAMTEAKHGISMARIEEDARLMLAHTPSSGLGDDLPEDVIGEFYPEEAHPNTPGLVEPEHHRVVTPSGAAPALVGPGEDVVDEATGEVIESDPTDISPETPAEETPPAETEQKSTRTRRTKAQIEADRLAAKTGASPAPEESPHPAAEASEEPPALAPPSEDGFPDPPDTVTVEPGGPAVEEGEEIGDLF